MGIARGGQDLEEVRLTLRFAGHQSQDRDIEGPATEVVDRDRLGLAHAARPDPVRERCRGGLVDDPHDLQAREPPCIAGRLALRVVKVRRDRDHGLLHRLPQRGFCPLLELTQDHRADFLRRVHLCARIRLDPDPRGVVLALDDGVPEIGRVRLRVPERASHQAFDGVDGPIGHLHDPIRRGLTHDERSVPLHADHRGHDLR